MSWHLRSARIEFIVGEFIVTAYDSCERLNWHCKGEKNIVPFDGALYLVKQFYQQSEADLLFAKLQAELAWQGKAIFIYGRWVKVPRLMCWYGDPGAWYRYSGVDHQPKPWTPVLQTIREKVERQSQCTFNSVLANLYRDGNDSMGCHADDEKELGPNPVIASLSLGDERLFKLHHKITKDKLDIVLGHGDLLVMGEPATPLDHRCRKRKN